MPTKQPKPQDPNQSGRQNNGPYDKFQAAFEVYSQENDEKLDGFHRENLEAIREIMQALEKIASITPSSSTQLTPTDSNLFIAFEAFHEKLVPQLQAIQTMIKQIPPAVRPTPVTSNTSAVAGLAELRKLVEEIQTLSKRLEQLEGRQEHLITRVAKSQQEIEAKIGTLGTVRVSQPVPIPITPVPIQRASSGSMCQHPTIDDEGDCLSCGRHFDKKTCRYCGYDVTRVEEGFCPHCGRSVEKKIKCPYCSEGNPVERDYCRECGSKLKK